MNRPVLSICIPTYNRANALKKHLQRLVCLDGFDDEVEIVISDNASTDDTESVGKQFASDYSNIKYFRNKENVRDSNFPIVLGHATGEYLKLMNDCCNWEEDGLIYMKEKVKEHLEDRTPIFFTNDFIYTKYKKETVYCSSLNEYVATLSTYVTANPCFGVWKEHWEDVKEPMKYSPLQLCQEDWTYQILENQNKCYLFDKKFYEVADTGSVRKGYNWFKVHLDNYYIIMQPYIDKGLISPKVLKGDKENLLRHFRPHLIYAWCVPYKYDGWQFDMSGTFGYFWKYHKTVPLFYWYLLTFPIWGTYNFLFACMKWTAKKITKKLGIYNKIKGIR